MPYLKDPRGRVTLNLPAAEYATLTADAAQAGYASPGRYATALVRARGAAPRPVLDENGRQRVAFLEDKLATVREALAATQARTAALATQLRAAQHELEQRPTRAQVQQAIEEGEVAATQKSRPPRKCRPRKPSHPIPRPLLPRKRPKAGGGA